MLLTHVNRLEDLKKKLTHTVRRIFGLYRYITFEVSRFKEKKSICSQIKLIQKVINS